MLLMYLLSPFLGYILGGGLKFIINVLKHKKIQLSFIGMGGMPSSHTSIATAPLTLCILHDGVNNSVVGIGSAFLLITIIDALDLRKKISNHAKIINFINKDQESLIELNENIHHTFLEILGGLLSGSFAGYLIYFLYNYIFIL